MSWFDAKGLNWAKTAFKEAVAQIDKALDIQEEGGGAASATPQEQQTITALAGSSRKQQKLPGAANRERVENTVSVPTQCTEKGKSPITTIVPSTPRATNTLPSFNVNAIPSNTTLTTSWGSFTGSFFENPNAQDTITAAPIPSGAPVTSPKGQHQLGGIDEDISRIHRQSIASTSTSESVEVLSPPASSAELQTSPDNASSNSASVEAISITPTFTNELESTNSYMCSSTSLPDSIVIIADEDACDKEEDSLSYKTVIDNTSDAVETEAATALQCATVSTSAISSTCYSDQKMVISMDETPSESHHADSDSTQSFEDIQLQTNSTGSQYVEKAQRVVLGSDDKNNSFKSSSPHNSNDEMETATSSDIEVISNPNGNGDSSSTNSTTTRTSPLKLKKLCGNQSSCHLPTKKGHFREPSEISILSEDSQSELDKLLHRISELNDLLEARELRLLQIERLNIELQERNAEMESAIDVMKANSGSLDSTEAYTQRLSALEKKFQASIRERDSLRLQIKKLKDELQEKIPKEELAESNAMIEELRLEGEKLSKEILQQSNIIKKLRTKEKTTDTQLKKNKEEIASISEELERLKKTLNAKEEVERSQIEAVHKMSAEKRKLEDENAQYRSKLEDVQSKLSTLQTSFEAAKRELQQRTQMYSDLSRSAENAVAEKNENQLLKAENQEIRQQLNDLREKMCEFQQQAAKKEQQLREESKELLRRLESAELRAEFSTQEASLTTAPLMRQLESLQNTLSQRTSQWNQEEKALLEKLEKKRKSLENIESRYEERIDLLQKRCSELEDNLSQALMQEEKAKLALNQVQLDCNLKETILQEQVSELNNQLRDYSEKIDLLERKNNTLEDKQSPQTEDKVRVYMLNDDVAHKDQESERYRDTGYGTRQELIYRQLSEQSQSHRSHSPSMSFGRNSLEEAMEGGSFDWQAEDMECISNSGRHPSNLAYGMHLNFMGHNASTLEHLQSMLKQRDGEIVHIQWELSRLQESRSVLSEEIASLTTELENAKEKLSAYETLEKSHEELRHNYDALLQMYGEKVERAEELELDLYELKEAYKIQIDELLAQPQKNT